MSDKEPGQHPAGAILLLPDRRDLLGESIVYDDRRNALAWVDIPGKRIHRLWLDDQRHETWAAPELATSIGLRKDGGAIVGLARRVALWDFGGEFRTLAMPEPDIADNRLNEGRVGPDGCFWVGTMQNNIAEDGGNLDVTRNSGAVYRIAPDGAVAQMTPREYGISNTMAWPGGNSFLFADTMRNTIFRFDLVGGTLKNRRVFFGPYERGVPDGSCLDSEDRLWNCRVVGGNAVACISAEGKLLRLEELPCSWPTSCTFGGPGLDRMFVTSANAHMTAEHLAANPLEGGLFEINPSATGRPENRFG
jgi:sugar lactone lactonase YvrE